jgi:ATP-binding cassette, subfamily B (MDR/TAP), member 1
MKDEDSVKAATGGDEKVKKQSKPQASIGETLSFVFESGSYVKMLFAFGVVGGIANGCVYPILAYLFASSFSDIGGASSNGLEQVRELAYTFMIVGVYALIAATIQTGCFEICAYHASTKFRLQWFRALLRQDPAFFDVNDISGLAALVGPSAAKYRRGVGRKFGEVRVQASCKCRNDFLPFDDSSSCT